MTEIVKTLNEAEVLRAQQQAQLIADSARSTVRADSFVFFVGFDGTNNSRDNLALSDTKQSTAVGLLTSQVEKLQVLNGNIAAKYFPGPGTENSVTGSSLLPGAVTAEDLQTASKAYDAFELEANKWLDANPGGTVSVMDVSFSRGAIASVAFKQLVYQRGLVDSSGRVMIKPGNVEFAPSLMIESVATGAYGNLAMPPGAAESITIVRAEHEQRTSFKIAGFGQTGVTYHDAMGNHGDAAALYDSGLGGIFLDGYAKFYRNAGLNLGSLPEERLYRPGDPVVIHAETSIYGLPWPTYEGPRQTDLVATPVWEQRFDDGSALSVFDDLWGKRIYSTQDTDGNWGQIEVVSASQAQPSMLNYKAKQP